MGDKIADFVRLASAYLKQASPRLEDAKEANEEDRNYPYAVRLSQECVELCVKAALRAIGVEYPKEHEVSGLLSKYKMRFPAWFVPEIPFVEGASKSLFKKRELAFYGGEEAFLSPEDVISRKDSEGAIQQAIRVFELSSKLVKEMSRPKSNKSRSKRS